MNNTSALINEGGEGYDPNVGNSQQRYERETAIINSGRAQFEAEWTLEVFTARREKWNAAVKAGEMTTNGKADTKKVQAFERKIGFTFSTLLEAKKLHGVS